MSDEKTLFDDEQTVTLTMEDDSVVECSVLSMFEAENGETYVALLPVDSEDGQVYLYRMIENADGEKDLANIESDEEYDIAADAFDEVMEELYGDEDEEDYEYDIYGDFDDDEEDGEDEE